MNGIVYDARRIMAYESFLMLGEYADKDKDFLDALWGEFLQNDGLMDEFMYYIDHHTLKDEVKCRGYSLTDLYVFQMSRYNLIRDIGKNTECCNKEAMVLNAFQTMANMLKDPETYVRRLLEDKGMDKLQ